MPKGLSEVINRRRAGKAMQWSNEKGQNDKQLSAKNYTEN
jgi:hypothetical protein